MVGGDLTQIVVLSTNTDHLLRQNLHLTNPMLRRTRCQCRLKNRFLLLVAIVIIDVVGGCRCRLSTVIFFDENFLAVTELGV